MKHGWGPVLLGVVLAWIPTSFAARQAGRAESETARVEAGRKVYAREKCATCHQIDRRGNSRFPLDGVASRLTPDQLRRWITETAKMEDALPRMPAVRMSAMKYRLSPEELTSLVEYLKTLK